MAMKKSVPARLLEKEVTQTLVRLMSEDRRCRKAVNINCERSRTVRPKGRIRLAYHDIAGEEVRTAEDYTRSPTGKNKAEIVRMRPGAFCWYQVAASVANITAQLSQWSEVRSCVA